MKILVLLVCCIGTALADNQAEASETSSSNKLSSTKSNLNSIPSAPAQKTTLIQQSQSLPVQQQQPQYVPQYLTKQVPAQHAAMFIIAQPNGAQPSTHGPVFQQAVHQLLSYYNNNPQAKYQLLQQQQPQNFHGLPSGALHVIPSPQLDNNQHVQQIAAPTSHSQQPQATYIIPAQSLQTLNGINPNLVAQLTGQLQQHQQQPQHIPVPVQYSQQQIIPQYQTQINPNHFITQQIPQFSGHFALPAQFAAGLGQPQIPGHIQAQLSHIPAQLQAHQLPANLQIGSSAPAQQFGVKQNGNNEFIAQTEKSQQSSSSSNYNPVYRTSYVKG